MVTYDLFARCMCFCSPLCFGLCWNDCAFILERACMIDYNIWRFLYVYFGHRSSCRTSNCSVPVSSAWTPLCIELLTQSVLIMWYMNQTKPPKFYQKINDIFHLNVCVEMFVQEHIHTRAHTFLFFLLSNNKNFQYFWSFTLFWSMLLLEQILCTCRLLHELFVIFWEKLLSSEIPIMKRLSSVASIFQLF